MTQTQKFTMSYFPAEPGEPLWDMTVPELMQWNAKDYPDRIALVEGVADPAKRRRWTYRQLVDEVTETARGLLEYFEPGDKVAIIAPETPEWVIFQHAICMAGLIIVPVNPAYTDRELAFVLRSSEAKGIVFAETSRGKALRPMVENAQVSLPDLVHAICIADLDRIKAHGDPDRVLPRLEPGEMMQIQYTSGTTGFPKGACLHHRGVINSARLIVERADFPVGGVWINSMPMFHIGGGIVSAIGTFSRHGTFVLMPQFDPALFLELIEAESVNCSLIVPTMILALLNHPDMKTRDVSSFRSILSGAAAVPAALVHRAKKEFDVEFAIMFGQTESNGPFIETLTTDPVELQCETIGRPIPHVEVKIVDLESLETVPVGTVGELWMRGFGTMIGYYGRSEATAAALTTDGWLRTGDLCTMDENGYMRIAGRLKEMIIRGGMNLYPKEIEEIIFDHPQVAQVAVLGVPDETWGEIVAAIVQPRSTDECPAAEELYGHCRKNLSPQKTPEKWFFVDSYPMTATGKIQKNVLAEMIQAGQLPEAVWVRPVRNSAIA
ncbi:class I adenylate-forming enzyme family protein [Paracoccus alkenifer]|uniref:Fatty-acyl-CoA synthase n=1 Tax=Paracoccus alkenifer TaxID=65735 RepID=A0A1H6NLP3_9RHOB|nr:AMP-binding protein [Paracoccus alkenifer]SEI13204.1 fatty-acyl-CoA synthase [Paracoccus alkenifer]